MAENGKAPEVQPVANIQMVLLSNGSLQVQATAPNPLIAFQMLGQATVQLAAEYAKQQQQKIQVAPPALVPRLLN